MPRKRYESQREAEKRYKAKTVRLALDFKTESEDEMRLLEYARSQQSAMQYIKDLIQADMEKQQQ